MWALWRITTSKPKHRGTYGVLPATHLTWSRRWGRNVVESPGVSTTQIGDLLSLSLFSLFLVKWGRNGWATRQKGNQPAKDEATTVILPPRRAPRDHGRGYPLSVLCPAMDGFGRQSKKKSGRGKVVPNRGEDKKRENKSGDYQIREQLRMPNRVLELAMAR